MWKKFDKEHLGEIQSHSRNGIRDSADGDTEPTLENHGNFNVTSYAVTPY
jgi:hypothetical protein